MSDLGVPFVLDVERVGKVELHGIGPWSVHQFGRGSYEIVDSLRAPAKPTVHQPIKGSFTGATRPHTNIVWAQGSIPATIVAAANAAFEKVGK